DYKAASTSQPQPGQSRQPEQPALLSTEPYDMTNQGLSAGNVVKSAANVGKSAAKFGKGVVDFMNPVNTAKNAASVPGNLWETVKSQVSAETSQKLAQHGIDKIINTIAQKKAAGEDTTHLEAFLKQPGIVQNPKELGTILDNLKNIGSAAYQTVTPPAAQKALQGKGTEALQSVAEDPYQLAPAFLAAKGAMETKAGVYDPANPKASGTSFAETKPGMAVDKAMSKTASTVTQPVAAAAKGVAAASKGVTNLAGTLARYATSQATGMSPETINAIIKDPQEFSKEKMQEYTRENIAQQVKSTIDAHLNDLSETGKEYEGIRKSGGVVNVDTSKVQSVLSRYGIKLDGSGKIITDKESIPLSAADKAALQEFVSTFGKEKQLSGNAFMNARTALSNMAKYDAAKTGASTTLARELRSVYDQQGKAQLKGLAELDAKYAPEVKLLQQIKTDYLKPDGTFKDNALSKIANLNNEGRQSVLARLEQISPGISKKISVLKAVEDIDKASGQKVGAYTRSAVAGAGLFLHTPTAVVMAILSHPEIATQILRGYGRLRGLSESAIQAIKAPENIQAIKNKVNPDIK